jgi:hypothetical protein
MNPITKWNLSMCETNGGHYLTAQGSDNKGRGIAPCAGSRAGAITLLPQGF